MALQQGPEPPPQYKVSVPLFAGTKTTVLGSSSVSSETDAPRSRCTVSVEAIATPRVEEGCLILQPSPTRLLWFPLGIITGPVEVEAL